MFTKCTECGWNARKIGKVPPSTWECRNSDCGNIWRMEDTQENRTRRYVTGVHVKESISRNRNPRRRNTNYYWSDRDDEPIGDTDPAEYYGDEVYENKD